MFETTKEEMMNKKAKRKAERMMANMMADMLLKSESVPEHTKLSVRALKKARDIHDLIEEGIVLKYTVPGNEADNETLKKVLEYLELVEVGMMQFVETTPFVKHTEEEEQ